MTFLEEIDAKIFEAKKSISEKYPHHCTSCNGRGGSMREGYEGARKFTMCKECVGKDLDPLNTTLNLVQPKKYGLYYYEDGEMWEAWWEHDNKEEHISPTLNLELEDEASWVKTDMGLCDRLEEIREQVSILKRNFDSLVGS